MSLHPFASTLGPGPYRFVGMFTINIAAGHAGRGYIDESQVHARFKAGAGTCAHCGQAILNVFQVQIGNGDVYGVGSDCIVKASASGESQQLLTDAEKAKKAHQKKLRDARREKKWQEAAQRLQALRELVEALLGANRERLAAMPHPNEFMAAKGKTRADWVEYMIHWGGEAKLKEIAAELKEAA